MKELAIKAALEAILSTSQDFTMGSIERLNIIKEKAEAALKLIESK